MNVDLRYQSSQASLFSSHARLTTEESETRTVNGLSFAVRSCPTCGLTYACKEKSHESTVCPVCGADSLCETSTRDVLPEKWTEYLDAYIGECLADGVAWVAVAQRKLQCVCPEKAGENENCPIHGRW